ncbi:uncharacterized protein LOC100680344 isoform X1 [Nasonia vitripennis]|uniref:Uncharacterized protein n=1 Tax=Nasonia vitripennis TaxID=7425 RepID=A0A7M7QC45_NASVI|nr:uncharacterized protein LOC100680344 isoform X1 [Nasonia vitripennis]
MTVSVAPVYAFFSILGSNILSSSIRKVILCVLVLSSLTPFVISEYSSDEDFPTETPSPIPLLNPRGFVNCGHAQRQLTVDSSLFNLGTVLDKCWHHGVTLDEIESGLKSVPEREDIENYEYADLYLLCEDVFTGNTSKLTSSLVRDYMECQSAGALQFEVMGYVERRFAEIIEVFTIGNQSLRIDESTLVPCRNASKRIVMLCREYGISEDQWRRGFLRYYYSDKWVVEEDLLDLSITCDQIFKARLEEEVFEDPVDMFVRCQNTMGIPQDTRDSFEKRNAEKLKEIREFDVQGLDLRSYVSCRHLQPIKLRNGLVSVSWYAYEKCKTIGVSYAELQAGIEARIDDEEIYKERDMNELYVNCETVFNDELYSFSTALSQDYEACKAAGRISSKTRKIIQKKFQKMFKIFETKKPQLSKNTDLVSHLVRCTNFPDRLVELCRRRGSTLAQELRGFGSLARVLGDRWLNTEPLERLYVRCDDLFDDHKKYVKEVPVDQYMQCRWVDEVSEETKKFIDKRISKLYVNKHKWNGTRYKGDSDVEISSVILFDEDGNSDVPITLT